MSKGAFYELVQRETDAFIEEAFGCTSRRNYEFWFNEPFEAGVLRQFRAVLGVIGWVAETDRLGMWPLTPRRLQEILRLAYPEEGVRNLAERGRSW